jgi:hypothetical protein
MATAILILGLPGSGKTHYLLDLAARTGAAFFDDFKKDAFRDDPAFGSARRLGELLADLWTERDCLISDIDFCLPESLQEAEAWIYGNAPPGTTIERRYFAPDRDQCIANVTARATRENRDVASELGDIERYLKTYVVPQGYEPLPVWREN